MRWGILGTARIAHAMVAAIRASGAGVVAAVASRDAARAQVWAQDHEIPEAFSSYEAMLESNAIDVVYNPLPNSLHAEWTIAALEAGLPVLCEKPFTTNAVEARAVAETARRTGLAVAEAFMYRFHPVYDVVVELILQGRIGELRTIESSFSFFLRDRSEIPASAELGGGALLDVGCYCVNLARLIAASEPIAAAALEKRTSVDDTFAGVLEFGDGVLAPFHCSIEAFDRSRAEIVGTDGAISVENPWFPGETAGTIYIRTESGEQCITTPGGKSYQLEALDFASAVREGRPPRWTVDDAIANMTVIDALIESAKTGAAVAIQTK